MASVERISEAFLLPALEVLLDAYPFVIRGFHSLNPYLNFHRPCFFPEVIVDAKGKQRKRYPYERMMTHYENLKSLPKAERFLKPNVTFEHPNTLAMQLSTFSGWAGTIIACRTTWTEQHRSKQLLDRWRRTYEQLSDEPA